MKKKRKLIGISLLILITTIIISCRNNQSFDSEKWKKKGIDWQLDDEREKMVGDLILSDTIIGLNKDEIFNLLGEPENFNEKKLKYLIREKHTWNVDPDYIKYLHIELDKNANAIKCYIEKTK